MAPSLINVDVLPGDDMSPEAIRGGATSLRRVGDKVFSDSADVVKTWGGIAHPYVAPESGQLVEAMNPVKTSGVTFDQNLCAAADALDTFAEAVRAIKKACDGIRTDAKLLLAQIDGNGKVGAGGIGPGSDWWHDPVTFDKNEALLTAVDAQAQLLKTAERACAGAIEGLAGGGQRGEHGGPGFATAPTVEDPPWGHVETVQEALEQAQQEGPTQQQGESQQALEALSGFVSMLGFDTSQFDVTEGHPSGQLFGHWSVHNIVANLESIGQAVFQHPVKTGTALFKDFTAWDDWSDHPGYAFGKVEVNLLLLGASFLKVGSLVRVGQAGREAAGVGVKAAGEAEKAAAAASRVARLAEVGRRAGQKVTVATVDGLKELTKAATNDKTWSKTLDRLDRAIRILRHDISVDEATTRDPVGPAVHNHKQAESGSPSAAEDRASHAGKHPPTDDSARPGDSTDARDRPASSELADRDSASDDDPGTDTSEAAPPPSSGSAHDLGGTGTKADPKKYWFHSPAEKLRSADKPTADELKYLDDYEAYDPGTKEHMNARWAAYEANPNTKDLSWEAWRNKYIANQGNNYKGLAFEDVVRHEKGLVDKVGVEQHVRPKKLPLVRDYDIFSGHADALEIKSNGSVVKAQLEKDIIAKGQGIKVRYVFGRYPTPSSIRLLKEAGIPWEVVYSEAVPVG